MQQPGFGIMIKSVAAPQEAVKAIALLYRDDGRANIIPHFFRIVGDRSGNVRALLERVGDEGAGQLGLVYASEKYEFLFVVNVLRHDLGHQDQASATACGILIDALLKACLLTTAEHKSCSAVIAFKREEEFNLASGRAGQDRVRKYLRYLKLPPSSLGGQEHSQQQTSEQAGFDLAIPEKPLPAT